MEGQVMEIAVDRLVAHPANSNVMPADLFEKLVGHMDRSGRYPPVIVRAVEPGEGGGASYQILDGHHRVAALRRLGVTTARCVVWEADEDEALLLLATLNRLQGQDDPRKRGALLSELLHRTGRDVASLSAQVPEAGARIERLLAVAAPAGPPRPPTPLAQMPVAVHFFLLPAQHRALEARLRAMGGTREAALMSLIEGDA